MTKETICMETNHFVCVHVLTHIDVKNAFYVFYYFYKKRVFNDFLFLERFLFSSLEIFYPTKPAKNPTKPVKFFHKTTFK